MSTLRTSAANKISYAIRRGVIRRPQVCPVCQRPRFVCAYPLDLARPLQTIHWACYRCAYAARTEQDLLPRTTREPARDVNGLPERLGLLPTRCAGVTRIGQQCARRGRYQRLGWKVCGCHRKPNARGPWGTY